MFFFGYTEKTKENVMSQKITIRNFNGQVLGTIEIEDNGNKTVKNFEGQVLGYYKADRDLTIDFFGRVVARGDVASSLLN
jgi:hypothetical protein